MALLVLALSPSSLPAQQPFVLTDGTPLRVRLNRSVSSADAKVGEPVDFDVVEDILVNGAVVIQRGSKVLATVTEAQPKGLMGKAGKLNVSLDHARSVLGEKIALRAVKENERGGDSGNIATVATSIVTAPLLLFMKGKDVTIPKGTEVTAYVHGDIRLDEARIRAQAVNVSMAGETADAAPPAPAAASTAAAPPQTAPAPAATPAPQAARRRRRAPPRRPPA